MAVVADEKHKINGKNEQGMEQENEETPPSGELISTVGALVGSVAGVWLKVRVLNTSQSKKLHTRAHMASNMLRTGDAWK